MGAIKEVAQVVITSPKSVAVVTTLTATHLQGWLIDWFNPIIGALTSVASLVVLVIVGRYHWYNTKKVKKENANSDSEKGDH